MVERAPKGLKASGRALWRAVLADFELNESERRMLIEAARTADQLDELSQVIADEGVLGSDGRPHPAMVEARLQRLSLARLLASLRIPDEDDDEDGLVRPQRRGRARGSYRGRR